MNTDPAFGTFVRKQRETLNRKAHGLFSVRKVAAILDIQPSYISKIERCEVPPPSEGTIVRLAQVLQVDPDELLAMAGKIPRDLREIITRRPRLFADLLRQLRDQPDHVIQRITEIAREEVP